MKSILLIALAGLILSVGVMMFRQNHRNETKDSAIPHESVVLEPEHSMDPAPADPTPAPEVERKADAVIEDLTLSSFSDYLMENELSPRAVAAVYDLTEDEALLRSALARNPDDEALLSRGAWLSEDHEFALKCAEKLREVSPENPVGDYLTAVLQMKNGGHIDTVKDLLMEGLTKGTLDVLDTTAISSRREALESAGVSAFEARHSAQSLYGPIASDSSILNEAARLIAETGDIELISMGVGMTQHFLEGKRNSLITQIAAAGSQQSLLSQLPPDHAFGDSGLTVAERINQIEKDSANFNNVLASFFEVVDDLTQSQLRSYAEDVITEGETAAVVRLLQNLPKAEDR